MSQKTRFTQSALAVAVALVSTQAWQQASSSTNSLHRGWVVPIPVKGRSLTMLVMPVVTRH